MLKYLILNNKNQARTGQTLPKYRDFFGLPQGRTFNWFGNWFERIKFCITVRAA